MKPQATPRQRNNSPRIESLSVLPVFLDLKGKTAVVVGDGNAALWKLELLASAGAHVRYVCSQPTAELLDLLSNGLRGVSIETENWRELDFAGAAIIVADVEKMEAEAFFTRALQHTSMVNIVDQPAFCTFQFGSIVNKSPLVIGISTSGAGPVLAQLVRNLLEAMLPNNIQVRVKQAAAIRARVNARLASPGLRRDYWRTFFGRSFGFLEIDRNANGAAHVVNASSVGDLTLRDVTRMQGADHIYHFAGMDEAILRYGRREALRVSYRSFEGVPDPGQLPPHSVIIASPCGQV